MAAPNRQLIISLQQKFYFASNSAQMLHCANSPTSLTGCKQTRFYIKLKWKTYLYCIMGWIPKLHSNLNRMGKCKVFTKEFESDFPTVLIV